MAFHTFKHPDFVSKYRNYRVITKDNPSSPVDDFVLAESFETVDELRVNFHMADDDWAQAQKAMHSKGYFVYSLGGLWSDLP